MGDSLLIVGSQDDKLAALLSKLGHQLVKTAPGEPLGEHLAKNDFDLVIVDAQLDPNWVDLCQYLRTDDSTSDVPIVCLSSDQDKIKELQENKFERIEFVDVPYSVGGVVSRVSMQLRMRKLDGAENSNARLGEMNAALRDLNDRFMQQLHEARQIHETLLPESLPQDNRFELAVAYVPLEEVGGDWYCIRKESDGQISVQIADVTGHGLSAAFICAMTKLARCATTKLYPDEVLGAMNSLMSPVLPQGRFVTLAAFNYDPATGKLYSARAGHPPLLVLKRSTNEVVQLKGDGFAIGFMDECVYQREEITLEVNDIALLYTDGIPEAADMNSELYGIERMSQALLKSTPADSTEQILTKLIDDFDTFRNGRLLKDDVTAIVLKRLV